MRFGQPDIFVGIHAPLVIVENGAPPYDIAYLVTEALPRRVRVRRLLAQRDPAASGIGGVVETPKGHELSYVVRENENAYCGPAMHEPGTNLHTDNPFVVGSVRTTPDRVQLINEWAAAVETHARLATSNENTT